MAFVESSDDTVARYWQQFSERLARHGDSVSEPLAFFQSIPKIDSVWRLSDFIAQSCIKDIKWLAVAIRSDLFAQGFSYAAIEAGLDEAIDGVVDETDYASRLRIFRRRMMVHIAWRDLTGQANVCETMQAVSWLAEVCIRSVAIYSEQLLMPRFGLPIVFDSSEKAQLVVLGLGKLGGYELNYSSDIDLIFAFNARGQTNGTKSVDNQVYFEKLGRKLIQLLDAVTEDGFVFRTDMRLRPNGDSGPLVLSFAAMEHYYQIQGRSWERYALIKARVVGGNDDCGAELLKMLIPFIYRKYVDFSAFESVRDLKRRISDNLVQHAHEADNIKLGTGGIREVEFFAQSFQLIYGGREPVLQTPSLYTTLAELLNLGHIDSEVHERLTAAYEYLRNLEHRLQMVRDEQTQRLPNEPFEQARIAMAMNEPDWQSLEKTLHQHRQYVHQQFQTILREPKSESVAEISKSAQLWQGGLSEAQAVEWLDQEGFVDSAELLRLLHAFKHSALCQTFSVAESQRLDKLMPLAITEAASLRQPQIGLKHFIDVIEKIGRRSIYFVLLTENALALKQLLALCEASPWVTRFIGQYPVILDELLHPIEAEIPKSKSDYESHLQRRWNKQDLAEDEEAQMDVLREFYLAETLRLVALDIAGLLDSRALEARITWLAEVLLAKSLSIATHWVAEKLPRPDGEIGVIAYGKLASQELGYNSDLDLVMSYRLFADNASTAQMADAERFYTRVSRKFLNIVTSQTRLGRLYELDMRLRPSGRSGMLVTSQTAFTEYQHHQAWTWEHQSLVRSRVVVGSDDYVAWFNSVRRSILSLPRDSARLIQDIQEMRAKMVQHNARSTDQLFDLKLDWGGIVDIEFLVQYWILRYAHECPQIIDSANTAALINALQHYGIIDAGVGEQLRAIYYRYLDRILVLKRYEEPPLVAQADFSEERTFLSQLWHKTIVSMLT